VWDLSSSKLQVRLAETPLDLDAAQALRYRVFYDEMGALPTAEMRLRQRDFDDFDGLCEHLLVIDPERSNGHPHVVGTYRLLRKSVAAGARGFYSQQEFDIGRLVDLPGEIVELGRSCVDAEYRTRAVMQLLWAGLARYIDDFDIRLMFGCASLPGTDPAEMGAALSYLHHFHLAPETLRPRALDTRYVKMGVLEPAEVDRPAALSALPPLMKGYLRVGGFVGDGAVVDHQFNTTDVCIIVKTDSISAKYRRHYMSSPKPLAA
jgi:putative hemolysin